MSGVVCDNKFPLILKGEINSLIFKRKKCLLDQKDTYSNEDGCQRWYFAIY